MHRSHALNPHALSVRCKRFEIAEIRCQDSRTGLGVSNDDSIDRRPSARTTAKKCSASSDRLPQFLRDVAGLEKPVRGGVVPGMPLKAFDEHGRGHPRRPQSFFTKGA